MGKRDESRSGGKKGYPNYGRVPIESLKKSRKGKHHDLLKKIMEDLRSSAPGFAVKIPRASTGNISVLNLRSAIVRAASKEKLTINSLSDDENFYVWKT